MIVIMSLKARRKPSTKQEVSGNLRSGFDQLSINMHLYRQILAVAIFLFATLSIAGPSRGDDFSAADQNLKPHATQPQARQIPVANEGKGQEPDIDIFALMSGTCSTVEIAGRYFACRSVAYFHSKQGRASFTIVLDDPSDESHVISFSGENGRKGQGDLYELPIDRMLLNSKDRPKVDGLPVPSVELSAGTCKQLGNLAARQISSISCLAMDKNGRRYQLQFQSDGLPITVRRVRPSLPTILQHPFK